MRLKQLHGHYLVRILRVLVPFFVLASIVVPLRNYLDRSSAEPLPVRFEARLEDNQSELTEGLRYFTHDADETLMSVESARTLGFQDGKHLLEEVLVKFYGEDGTTPELEIDGVRCDFVQASFRVDCDDEVQMQLDENTTGYTTSLTYNHANRTVRTLAATRISRRGEFEAEGDGMIVRMALDEYVLVGNVRISTVDGTILSADRAMYRERLDRVDLVGAHLVSGSSDLRGGRAIVGLDSGTFRARNVMVYEGVFAESFDPANPQELTADRLNLEIAEGIVRSVIARGKVTLASGAGEDRWSMSGNRIDASLDTEGGLEALETRGEARMTFESGQQLRGTTIRSASGLITTTGESALESGEFLIEGRGFTVERGETIGFRTESEASIETAEGVYKGRRTEARFDPELGQLISMIQSGGVEFELGERSGSADQLQVRAGGDEIHLEGRASVEEPTLNLEAAEITLHRLDQSFTARNSVQAWLFGEDEPSLILGERAEGAGGRITFFDEAQLWWPGADTQVRASSIELNPELRSFVADGGVVSTGEGLKVWSDHLVFDEALVSYRGDVRALNADIDATSDDLEISLADSEPERVIATGSVRIRGRRFEGLGERAEYTPSTRMLILTGENAQVSNPELGDIRSSRLEVNLETEAIVASAEGGGRIVSTGVSTSR